MAGRLFFIPVGNLEAWGHFQDTIKTKKSLDEIVRFIPESDLGVLRQIFGRRSPAIWGSVPGTGTLRNWAKMAAQDTIVFNRGEEIVCVGEIVYTLRNADLARYLWGDNADGNTWEAIYFIDNEKHLTVPFREFNGQLGYSDQFRPRGLAPI